MDRLTRSGDVLGAMTTDNLPTTLLISSTVATGLSAGLLYGFACAVMPGLKEVDDRAFVAVMQSVNRRILNGWFLAHVRRCARVLTIGAGSRCLRRRHRRITGSPSAARRCCPCCRSRITGVGQRPAQQRPRCGRRPRCTGHRASTAVRCCVSNGDGLVATSRGLRRRQRRSAGWSWALAAATGHSWRWTRADAGLRAVARSDQSTRSCQASRTTVPGAADSRAASSTCAVSTASDRLDRRWPVTGHRAGRPLGSRCPTGHVRSARGRALTRCTAGPTPTPVRRPSPRRARRGSHRP